MDHTYDNAAEAEAGVSVEVVNEIMDAIADQDLA